MKLTKVSLLEMVLKGYETEEVQNIYKVIPLGLEIDDCMLLSIVGCKLFSVRFFVLIQNVWALFTLFLFFNHLITNVYAGTVRQNILNLRFWYFISIAFIIKFIDGLSKSHIYEPLLTPISFSYMVFLVLPITSFSRQSLDFLHIINDSSYRYFKIMVYALYVINAISVILIIIYTLFDRYKLPKIHNFVNVYITFQDSISFATCSFILIFTYIFTEKIRNFLDQSFIYTIRMLLVLLSFTQIIKLSFLALTASSNFKLPYVIYFSLDPLKYYKASAAIAIIADYLAFIFPSMIFGILFIMSSRLNKKDEKQITEDEHFDDNSQAEQGKFDF